MDNVCFPLLTTFVSPLQYPISFFPVICISMSNYSSFHVQCFSSLVVLWCTFFSSCCPSLFMPPFPCLSLPALFSCHLNARVSICLSIVSRCSLPLFLMYLIVSLLFRCRPTPFSVFFILYVVNVWPPRPYFSCIAPTCFCIFLRLLVPLYISTVAW